MVRTFRQSEVKAFKDCPRNWSLQYHEALVRKRAEGETSTAAIGTMYHRMVEGWYSGTPYFVPEGTDPKVKRLAERMFEGYIEWLAETGADQGLEIVSYERQIEVPFGTYLGDEVILTGRLDLEVVDEWGFEKVIDHKSVQNLEQADFLYLNEQGRTYSLLRRMEGRPITEFVHNQARRVLRSWTANPPFYSRVGVRYNDALLDSHHAHLVGTITKMVEAAQMLEENPDAHHLVVPPNPTRDCSWKCAFLHMCPMMDDGSDFEGYKLEFFEKAGILDELEEGGED